MYITLYYYQK